ncbi:MAG: ROK family protein [Blastocatellia bacterium]|nr:ROK family protein [Blastocatellia bacterium]
MTETIENPLYIGLDIEGKSLRAVLCDEEGQIIALRRQTFSTLAEQPVCEQIVTVIRELQESEGDTASFVGVGLGVPGLVNLQTNQIELWKDLRHSTSVTFYNAILESTGLPTVIDNRVNTAAYGEWQAGIGRGFQHIFYVDIGHHVGASLIVNGQMWRGALGFAGEIGFNTIDIDAERTLDSAVSGDSIVRRVQERLHRDRTSSLSRLAIPRDREMTLEDVVNSARAGDELAQVVLERTGLYLGVGLSSLINLLNPELVVLGGVGMVAGDLFLRPVIAETERRTFDLAFKNCRIVGAQLGINAAMVGAAMLARDSL